MPESEIAVFQYKRAHFVVRERILLYTIFQRVGTFSQLWAFDCECWSLYNCPTFWRCCKHYDKPKEIEKQDSFHGGIEDDLGETELVVLEIADISWFILGYTCAVVLNNK